MSTGCHYPTAVTEAPWEVLPPLLPAPQWRPGGPGRPPCDRRRVMPGILYVKKTGCQWRRLPKDFGPWETVEGVLRRWHRADGWARVMTELRRRARRGQGRLAEPSAGAIESQRVKTATQNQDVGFDGNTKIKGRKRHLLGDTLGLSVAVVVTAAHVDARQSLMALLHGYGTDGVTRLRKLWVDGGYRAEWLHAWVAGFKRTSTIAMEVVEHSGKGFQVVPHRWVVERTVAWLLHYRRHRCDLEGPLCVSLPNISCVTRWSW